MNLLVAFIAQVNKRVLRGKFNNLVLEKISETYDIDDVKFFIEEIECTRYSSSANLGIV